MKIGQAIDHVMSRITELGLEREPICYNASEAVYKLAGGSKSGLKVKRIKTGNHWFLAGPNGEIFDVTAGQFTRYTYKKLPSYKSARGCSFFPNTSNLAKKLMK